MFQLFSPKMIAKVRAFVRKNYSWPMSNPAMTQENKIGYLMACSRMDYGFPSELAGYPLEKLRLFFMAVVLEEEESEALKLRKEDAQ